MRDEQMRETKNTLERYEKIRDMKEHDKMIQNTR